MKIMFFSILHRHVFVMIMPMGTAKGMISQVVFHCLDRRRSLVSISENSSLKLASVVAAQPCYTPCKTQF